MFDHIGFHQIDRLQLPWPRTGWRRCRDGRIDGWMDGPFYLRSFVIFSQMFSVDDRSAWHTGQISRNSSDVSGSLLHCSCFLHASILTPGLLWIQWWTGFSYSWSTTELSQDHNLSKLGFFAVPHVHRNILHFLAILILCHLKVEISK